MPHDSDHTFSASSIGPNPEPSDDQAVNEAHKPESPVDDRGSAETSAHDEPAARPDPPARQSRAAPAAATVSNTRARLVVPMGIAGVLAAIIISSLFQTEEPHTVSEVVRQIREIALRTSDKPGVEDGGPLGLMWIAASDIDVLTGTMNQVRVRAGEVRLAARDGRVIADPEENTISFSLEDVVLFHLPRGSADAEPDHSVTELDSFVLGPIPYKRRIVADGHPAGRRESPKHLAEVQPE